jgi:DNA-directed RNA polymerase subunit RPC12/RpoP
MSRFDYKCPNCRTPIGQISAAQSRGFVCPSCGELLRVSPGPYKLVWIMSVLITACSFLAFDVRGWTLLFATVVVSLVLYVFGQVIASLIIPPKLERK